SRKPFLQSGCWMRSSIRAMMMSSDTRPPDAITSFTCRPSSDSALTAARSISPVEIWGISKRSVINWAWVPLPAPGAPNMMIRITLCSHCFILSFEKLWQRLLPLRQPLAGSGPSNPARTHKNEAALYELTPCRESRPLYHCPKAGLSAASEGDCRAEDNQEAREEASTSRSEATWSMSL